MRVAGLTASGDWQFGKGKASYLTRSDAIAQNVVTRLRSFTDDWFLDISDGLPWFELMGNKETERRTLREIERVVLSTFGVRSITLLRIDSIGTHRDAQLRLTYNDIFNTEINETVTLP